jgi:hypothetical protein
MVGEQVERSGVWLFSSGRVGKFYLPTNTQIRVGEVKICPPYHLNIAGQRPGFLQTLAID